MSWRKLLLPLFFVFTASPSFAPKGDQWDERGEFLGTRRQLRQHVRAIVKDRELLAQSAEKREEEEWNKALQLFQHAEWGKVPTGRCARVKKPFTLEKPTLLSAFVKAPRVELRLSQHYIEAIKRGKKTVDSRFDVWSPGSVDVHSCALRNYRRCDSVPTLRRLLKVEEIPSDKKARVQRALADPSMHLQVRLSSQEGDNGIKFTRVLLSLLDGEFSHGLCTFRHSKIHPGHTVWYAGRVESKGVLCLVTKVESFHNFGDLFANIPYQRYFPDARSKEDAIRKTARFSSPGEEAMFGIRALHLEPIACGGPDHFLPLSTDTEGRT